MSPDELRIGKREKKRVEESQEEVDRDEGR